MHRFRVWAPRAHTMAVSINGTTLPMNGPDDRGTWWLDDAHAGPGSDFGFLIDGDSTPWPDPRSQWQPNGVHGLSRIYDQRAFKWSDHGFVPRPFSSGVLYELHAGTFTSQGTLDAAIDKLSELCELGITHVELMPMASFPGRQGWGYDGVAISAVHEPYGGPDALKRFVDAAHKSGLAVLLDVVYNHFGPVGNYTGKFGPYIDDKHHTPWGGAVNLEDAGAHEVRRFFCDNALMWLRDFHIDGLRIDAVHAFVDRSAIHFLEQLATEVESLEASSGRNLVLIAESDLNDPRFVTPREANGLGVDAQWSDDFHHALFAVLTGLTDGYYADFGSLSQLAKALEQTFVYDGVYSGYRQRVHGRPVCGLSQHRFLGYIQNHDQVGNRAVGDRLSHIAGMERAKIAAAIVLLGPFIPMLFQGEEWACTSPFQYFVDHEPEMAKLVSEGRRKEFAAFGWEPESIPDPQSPATYERSRLNWEERSQPEHAAMLKWHRDLIALRRSTPCLNNGEQGNTQATYNEDENWIRFDRGTVAVLCNLAKESRSFTVSQKDRLLLGSHDGVTVDGSELVLPGESVAVLQKWRIESA